MSIGCVFDFISLIRFLQPVSILNQKSNPNNGRMEQPFTRQAMLRPTYASSGMAKFIFWKQYDYTSGKMTFVIGS